LWQRWSRWRKRRHGKDQGVIEPREGPPLLLLTDEDDHRELLLLGELGRHDERQAKVGSLEVVVDDVVDHVISVSSRTTQPLYTWPKTSPMMRVGCWAWIEGNMP
jgi:hypothetical protein